MLVRALHHHRSVEIAGKTKRDGGLWNVLSHSLPSKTGVFFGIPGRNNRNIGLGCEKSPTHPMNPIRVCVVGAGQFAQCFLPLFRAHPLVREVSLCEQLPARLATEAKNFGVTRTFRSYRDVLKSRDVDAVALFTQRWTHAELALKALRAGKHVYCAVPAATTLEELQSLVEAVQSTGLTYMMGETSVYYGNRLFCRERWDSGEFGRFVYGEGEYLHDMSHGFYDAFKYSGGARWKKTASFPPMLYPTHSVAMILSVTGARMTRVSCLGYVDQHSDGVFRKSVSQWKNVFSNQTALFRTSDGGSARINEFRRVGVRECRSVRLSLYGTEGAFEEQADGAIWTSLTEPPASVEKEIRCQGVYSKEAWDRIKVNEALKKEFAGGFARIHRKYRIRLPKSFRSEPNGHEGSHQFLVDDFVTSAVANRLPSVSIWDAARYNAPGIIAHASSVKDGETLAIPDFGSPRR
jgi:predicted dehydrogenase